MSTQEIRALAISEMIGRKVLVTCDNWFFAPDGRQYRAVHGTLVAVQNSEETLGIKVSARSHDWYMTVGNIKIAGCQIHYAVLADNVERGRVTDHTTKTDGSHVEYERNSYIFFSDDVS